MNSDPDIRTVRLAELMHDQSITDDNDRIYGIMRNVSYDERKLIDENKHELAPFRGDWNTLMKNAERLGMIEAWKFIDFGDRYRDHLDDEEKIEEMKKIKAEGMVRTVWIVDHEKSEKYSPRRVLKEVIEETPLP